jgi:chromosome segregation ATPase
MSRLLQLAGSALLGAAVCYMLIRAVNRVPVPTVMTPATEQQAAPVPPAAGTTAAEPRPAPPTREPSAAIRPQDRHEDDATRRELLRLLDEKNAKLAAAESAMGDLKDKLAALETKLAGVTEEMDRLTASGKDLQERLDTSARLAESLQAQMRAREERLAQVEVSNQDLRKRTDDTARRFARLGELAHQIEEVERRREVYLANVLRRYREATELFRTLALRLDNPRDAAAPTSNDLSRIQQAITLADEDLRQVTTLNNQSARLQREISGVRK